MNISALLSEAALLMGTGMAVVFVFLSILILAIKLLTKFATAFPDPQPALVKSSPTKINTNNPSPQIVAAISAAVKQYKARQK